MEFRIALQWNRPWISFLGNSEGFWLMFLALHGDIFDDRILPGSGSHVVLAQSLAVHKVPNAVVSLPQCGHVNI